MMVWNVKNYLQTSESTLFTFTIMHYADAFVQTNFEEQKQFINEPAIFIISTALGRCASCSLRNFSGVKGHFFISSHVFKLRLIIYTIWA